MQPDKKLRTVARKVKQATAKQDESVPLDQPFPEELDMPQPEPSKHDEKLKDKEDEPADILSPKQAEEENQHKEDDEEKPTLIAGYPVSELAAAPIKPPEPTKTESKRMTGNNTVKFLMIMGVVLFLLGIVLVLAFNAIFGVIVAFLGALAVISGVFIPLK